MNTSQFLSETLVDHIPKIRRIVSRIAKNEGVVDDITQEACLRIIEKERLWRKRSNKLPQWMNTVTRNLTKDCLKKKRKEQSLEGREDCFLQPEDEKFSEEQIEWVIIQFQTLSKKQKQILNMKYYQGMTVTQIGKEIGVTQQAVSQHITLALKVLRKRAKAHGILAVLFPWKWDRSMYIQVVVMNKIKLVAVLFCLFLGFLGYKIFSGDIESAGGEMKDLDIGQPASFEVPDKTSAQLNSSGNKGLNVLKTGSDISKEKDTVSQNVSDADLAETLKWLKELKEEEFGKWTIEDLRNAEKMDLSETAFDENDLIRYLKFFTSITELNLQNTGVTDKVLQEFNSLIFLRKLDLLGTKITDTGLKHLSALTSLQELELWGTRITNEGLKHLSPLTSLKQLGLKNTQITDEGFKHLEPLTSLTSLNLKNTGITNKSMRHIGTLTDLTELLLADISVTDEGLQELSSLTSLKTLNLWRTDITDEGMKHLGLLTSLEYLSLELTSVTGKEFEYLSSLTSLKGLYLRMSGIKDEGLKHLSTTTSLNWLQLADTDVSDEGLKHLHRLTSLIWLDLRGTNVTNEGVEAIKEALPNCKIYE